ncbi:hypothetical protein CKO51_21300 [Rhodopirellula sp. SM50]|nr:hypothetical protein CKO51_21300 [Rhodopirellula sp. SM50]
MNMPLPKLASKLDGVHGSANSYVVGSVSYHGKSNQFKQRGSAPNFQGDVLTLCTCKHQMRSRKSADEWESNVWIAGFTSRTIHKNRHWLVYLAKVQWAYDSHCELWIDMNDKSRTAKAAHLHYLGDMFKPKTPYPKGKARHSAGRYYTPPCHSHRSSPNVNAWRKDIQYRHAVSSRRAALLRADPKRTFLWSEPLVYLTQKHCRDYAAWPTIRDLVDALE